MSETARVAAHIIVYGRVQGVGFRSWTASQARRHTISGWVRNNEDGSVELVAEGSDANLALFIDAIRAGNGYSIVEDIKINRVQPSGFTRFEIDY